MNSSHFRYRPALAQALLPGLAASSLRPKPLKMSNQGRHRSIRALECPPGAEYDEETFLYFLAIERARAERSKQRLWLLLVTLEPAPGKPVPIPPASAARLFEGLKLSLRETDIMGWYRQDRVVGAVLSARADAPELETSDLIAKRVGEELREHLSSRICRSLRVRVTQQGPRRVVRR